MGSLYNMKIPQEILDASWNIGKYENRDGFFNPSSTGTNAHDTINELIANYGRPQYTMGVDRTPEYIGGIDDITANVALSPLLTMKSILGSKAGARFLEKIGLENPLTHYTSARNAMKILTPAGAPERLLKAVFHGDAAKVRRLLANYDGIMGANNSVSFTRDPKFLSRNHGSIGTDVGLIVDKGDLITKGYRIKPYAEKGFQKVNRTWDTKEYIRMNPHFEFEERLMGVVPTDDIKLLDFTKFTLNHSLFSSKNRELLNSLVRSKKPIIKSSLADEDLNILNDITKSALKGSKGVFGKSLEKSLLNIEELLNTPTYKHNPFLKPK
jgi:hypothetical protein